MKRFVCSLSMLSISLVLGVGSGASGHAVLQETEVREFNIDIEGKTAGKCTMTITKQDDGTLSMRSKADISVKFLRFFSYTYNFSGVEHWKDGRLMQMQSSCNDDGTRTDLTAAAQHDSLVINVNNGAPRKCRWDVWTTTYWMLADQRFHNNPVPLLDADTGKEYVAQLKFVSREPAMFNGQQQNWHHFRVTGGPTSLTSPCDLWFDEQQRLARQEFIDQGKRVVFTLTAIRR
jgi:hypothetical protein